MVGSAPVGGRTAWPIGPVGLGSLAAVLVGVGFLDELASGVPFVGTPEVRSEFGVGYGAAAGGLLAAAAALALVLEPPIFLFADRRPRRPFVVSGLLGLAGACFLGALAPSYAWLFVALLLYGPASGAACGLAQATLMDANPDERERWMVRWTLAGELGDLAAPGLVWLSVALGGSYRLAFGAAGALFLAQAVRVARRPFPARSTSGGEDDDGPFLPRLRASLAAPGLWPWAFATLACTLMDEIVVAFGALYVTERLDAPVSVRAAILGAGVLGGALGLFAADRWLVRFEPRRLLLASAAACAACYALWLRADTPVASGALFAATGFFSALHYPLAMAQLYRVLPDASGTVNALMTVVGVVEVPLPLALGFVADGAGLAVAMALLLLQPVVVGGVALASLHAVARGAR